MDTSKTRFLYRASTGLLAFIMGGSGLADVLRLEPARVIFAHLGYPEYALTIIGTAKMAGACVILFSRRSWILEWAYAGIVIDLGGAAASHVAVGDPITEIIKPIFVLALAIVSYRLWRLNYNF